MKFDVNTILFFQKLVVDNYLLYKQLQKDHAELKPAAQLYAEADAKGLEIRDRLAKDKAENP